MGAELKWLTFSNQKPRAILLAAVKHEKADPHLYAALPVETLMGRIKRCRGEGEEEADEELLKQLFPSFDGVQLMNLVVKCAHAFPGVVRAETLARGCIYEDALLKISEGAPRPTEKVAAVSGRYHQAIAEYVDLLKARIDEIQGESPSEDEPPESKN